MAEQRVQRRLAAILAADVVGYSRLMREDETGTLAQLNTLRKELLDPKVEEYGGRIVKTTGDGVLVEFPSAVDAVQHAVDVQQALARRGFDVPQDRRIELRMGINLGDVIVEDDDIFGDGVNVAARLEGLANPGEICVSEFVHAQVRHKLNLAYESMGEQSLKNIAEPIDVYRVTIKHATDGSRDTAATEAIFRRPAVAVLPFENISGDSEQDYFADGLTEDIITALSLWKSFPVIARNSTFAYKGQSPDIRKVGEELGARYVVEGSVRKAGNRVRVTAQLINAETGHHVWAERYDRDLKDIFAIQDEISREIATIIEPAIEHSEHQRINAKPPSELGAWELCVRGFAHLHEVTREANEKARVMFERAIALDPNYARAHTGLAFSHGRDLRFFGTEDRENSVRLMFESARRAATLDEADADARTMLVRAHLHAGRMDAAVAEGRKAVQLNPHNADANNILGALLSTVLGKFEEGIPWIERALQLNPSDPWHQVIVVHLALGHLGAGRYEEAARHARDALRRQPDFIDGIVALAASLGFLGCIDEARTTIEGHEDGIPVFMERNVRFAPQLKECLSEGLHRAGVTT